MLLIELNDDLPGTRICGYHPWHVDLRLLRRRRRIRSLSPLGVCAPRAAPPRVLLRRREPHVPPRGRVLRCGDCYQVLRGVHQVRSFLHVRVGGDCRADVNELRRQNSYLIIIKSLLPNVVASLYHDLASPDTNPPVWALSGHVWISLVMIVLVPLSFLRRLDSLRHASYVALFSCGQYFLPFSRLWDADLTACWARAVYLVLIVIACYFRPIKGMTAPGEIHFIKFTPSFISTFPIQVFAFTCAQNVKTVYPSRFDVRC